MAKKKYSNEEGVWRTIGGRRVFIRTGQSLSDAMKNSGKFKNMSKDVQDNVEFKDMKEDRIKRQGVTAGEYRKAENMRATLGKEGKFEEALEAQKKYDSLMEKDGYLERKYQMPTEGRMSREEYESYAKRIPDRKGYAKTSYSDYVEETKNVGSVKEVNDSIRNWKGYDEGYDKYLEAKKISKEKEEERLQSFAKFYDIDKETAKQTYHFPGDVKYAKKYGAGKYDESEWAKIDDDLENYKKEIGFKKIEEKNIPKGFDREVIDRYNQGPEHRGQSWSAVAGKWEDEDEFRERVAGIVPEDFTKVNEKTTYDFGKIDAYGNGKKSNRATIEMQLKDGVFTASGNIWNSRGTDIISGGQNLDELKEYFGDNEDFNTIYNMWKKYHLNDMHAGTEKQESILEKFASEKDLIRKELDAKKNEGYKFIHNDVSNYEVDVELLKRHNLYEDNGYKYGSGWLKRDIPKEDLKTIAGLIRNNNLRERYSQTYKSLKESTNMSDSEIMEILKILDKKEK